MEDKSLEMISDYLAGSLTEAESLAVEQRMKADDTFASLVHAHMKDIALLQADHRAKLKADIKQEFQTYQKKRFTIRTMWFSGAIAAAVSLFVVFYLNQPKATPQQLAMAYQEPFPIRLERGETISTDSAIILYQGQEYGRALPYWKEKVSDSSTTTDLFYMAECYRLTGRYEEAISIYLELSEAPLIRDAVQWRLALSYVLSGQDTKAQTELEDISRQNHFRKKEADGLLEVMKR